MDRSFRERGTHLGLPAYPVASVAELGFSSAPHVVVAIFRHDIDISDVFTTLPSLGFASVMAFQELVERYPGTFDNVLWQGGRSQLAPARDELARVLTVLADEPSQQTFLDCLRLRMGDARAMQKPDRVHQYFPPDILPQGRSFRLVDCGAYDGDSWQMICEHGIRLDAFVALEADAGNYAKLAARMRDDARRPPETVLLPCAVWSSTTTLRFGSGAEHNSHVDAKGGTYVQAVTLDDALAGFHTTWLKLDVEGAELDALAGARRVIARDRPFLSVSAYHYPDHLWKLPLLLDGWRLGYRLYLRPHGYAGVDMVLYARAD
jgi:FkbM family methyltransferase